MNLDIIIFLIVSGVCGFGLFFIWYKSDQRHLKLIGIKDDCLEYDLMIAHPPCTYLAVSGARWNVNNPERQLMQEYAIDFVKDLMNAPINRIAIENPISVLSSKIRKPDQIIQPWMFGHGETKATCLWLKNLSKLEPTNIVSGREGRVHYESPGKDRWKNRSRTLEGIAEAMAEQWGKLELLCETKDRNCST